MVVNARLVFQVVKNRCDSEHIIVENVLLSMMFGAYCINSVDLPFDNNQTK